MKRKLPVKLESPKDLAVVKQVGFWAAITSAIFAVLWFLGYSMKDALWSVPDWQQLDAYAQSFSIIRHMYIYPSLLLPISFIALMASIHLLSKDSRKIWSLIGLSLGILYAVMASVNYNIQAVAVRMSLAAGETGGIEMLLPDNPHSIFTALANSYVYMSLAMFFTAFAFSKERGLGKWVRWLFLTQIISAIGQIGWSMFDLPMGIFITSSMVWVVGVPASCILLALMFKKAPYWK